MSSSIRQLELNLAGALGEAAEMPETVDVVALWQQFEDKLSGLSQRDQLRIAGAALSELANLCEAKSEIFWEDWQDAHNTEGPVMSEEWLSGLSRQTQALDFSGLVSRSYGKRAAVEESLAPEASIAGQADKANVIAMLDEIEENELKAQALAVSHSENVSKWIEALNNKQMDSPQRLIDLQQQLQMPLIEVWIAALLGGFELEQRGSFYQTQEVWVSGYR